MEKQKHTRRKNRVKTTTRTTRKKHSFLKEEKFQSISQVIRRAVKNWFLQSKEMLKT
jgi:hypothetical protein